ncbi:MAG: tail fiber domain-containing protein [Bacteroidia bacterium]
MKNSIQKIKIILAVSIMTATSANAQWSRNAAAGKTFLSNINDKVGVGTNNPANEIDVQSPGAARIGIKANGGAGAFLFMEKAQATDAATVSYRTAGQAKWQTGTLGNNDYVINNFPLGAKAVTVLSSNNNVGIGTVTPAASLSVKSTSLSGINTTGSFQIGESNTTNLVLDNNEVQARFNGTGSTLFLNFWGGGINMVNGGGNVGIGTSQSTSKVTIDGPQYLSTLTTPALLQLGLDNFTNLSFDVNQVQARNNGSASNLFLNPYGGYTTVGGLFAASTELQVEQGLGNGATHGLRIRNTGSNNHYWTFYTTDANDNLELNYLGIAKANINGVSGAYTAVSDRRFKKDIEKSDNVLDKLNKLELLKYHFNEQKSTDRKFYGMIAQDVEKFFPEVVFNNKPDSGESYYTMDYSAFGLIAIKGLQEMNVENTSLKNELSDLKKQLTDMNDCVQSLCNAQSGKIGEVAMQHSQLFQNQPNPFTTQTVINYQLNSGDANSKIIIRDLSGNLVKQVNLTQTGKGQVTINANELAQGTYTYTLEVNRTSVDTKLMVLVK